MCMFSSLQLVQSTYCSYNFCRKKPRVKKTFTFMIEVRRDRQLTLLTDFKKKLERKFKTLHTNVTLNAHI